MKQMIRNILCCLAFILLSSGLHAQEGYTDRAKKYVEHYFELAIAEQRASGIPASIILGQGLLETEAGTSELMTMANNHFGIKCKNGWQGPTFLHTDDAKDECFKKYKSAEESYRDHSAHLMNNPRYASLFKCSKTDYAAWAVGLKRCGYATNPQYAQRLIKIIEDFRLQEYTYAALDSYMLHTYPALADESTDQLFNPKAPAKKDYVKDTAHITGADTAKTLASKISRDSAKSLTPITDSSGVLLAQADIDPLKKMVDSTNDELRHKQEQEQIHAAAASDTSRIVIVNGLKAFAAQKNEMLLEYAVKYKMRYPHLLELNDLSDAPLPFDMYVYLEKKLTSGTHDKHTVQNGETLLMIAQQEGMQLKKLMSINLLVPGEEPLPGTVLELQTPPGKKPLVKLNPFKAHKTNAIVTGNAKDTTADSNLMATYKAPVYSSLADTTVPKEKNTTIPPAQKHEVEASYGASFAPPVENKPDSTPAKSAADDSKNYVTIDRSKPAAATVQKDNKLSTPDKKTAIPVATTTVNTTPAVAKQDTAKHEDLSKLKSELDKTVYADPPKTSFMKDDPSQPQLKKPAVEKEYKKGDKYYIVRRGDTAYSIAKNHDITVAQLLKWNDTEPQDIKAGQTLKVKE